MKLKEAKKNLEEAKKNNSRFWIKYWQNVVDELTTKNKKGENDNESSTAEL